ncbi:MAG: hypothetical protein J6A61_02275 [Clostridia bacterium]|nr:hypothetical protein [Clostridia bacterium]
MTNQEKQEYLTQRRYFYAVTPTYYGSPKQYAKKRKEAEEKEKRKKKILDYLNQAKKSAIKRGMYNQKPYQKVVSEANKNV